MLAQAIMPPLVLVPAWPRKTQASTKPIGQLPTSTEPIMCDIPWATAGLMVTWHVAKRAKIVSGGMVGGLEFTELLLHFVSRLPGANDHLPTRPIAWLSLDMIENAPMSCRIPRLQSFGPDARLSKRDVLGNLRVEVMTDHQHVEMLLDGVDGERPRRVGRGRQDVGLPQTRMMSGACPPPAPSEWNV
ncbi:MAG: hypothetical protein CM1200mP29_16670 [Verrucomicrobiota bacterium]|nr:MAG: hypothetical protein CM1200mP29_16670 [Verrucomicrobiota bacterium]